VLRRITYKKVPNNKRQHVLKTAYC